MTPRTRPFRLLAVLVALAAMLAGCPVDSTTPVDESRLAVLRAEAEAAGAQVTSAVAGWQESKRLAPVRGRVGATFADAETAEPVTAARDEAKKAMDILRANGWTIYLVACIPPVAGDDIDDDGPLPPALFDAWTFTAYGYKIVDGVSYSVQVDATGHLTHSRAHVTLWLLAPYSGEAVADLFPDRPTATDAGASCIEQAAPPDGLATVGTLAVMDERGPDPDTPKPDGRR